MLTPSLVLTNTKFGHTVSVKLYGNVTPARIAEEERLLAWRADQLSPARHTPKPVVDRRLGEMDDDIFDDVSFQSTGR